MKLRYTVGIIVLVLAGAALFAKGTAIAGLLPAALTAGVGAAFPTKDHPHLAYYPTPTPVLELKAPRTPPKGYKEYRNEFYRFQMFYPDDMEVQLVKEAATGSATLIFQNKEYTEAFQIFVIPYGDTTFPEYRFKSDLTSDVLTDKTHITVDGEDATAFHSKDESMGDTREVWFIGRGFLYEVTTYKPLDSWLAEIMKTWRFL
jgi:hypothetical protein